MIIPIMTQAELDALPECGGVGYYFENGATIPIMRPVFALYQPPDEPMMVTDTYGQSWQLGYAYGKRYKRKMEG